MICYKCKKRKSVKRAREFRCQKCINIDIQNEEEVARIVNNQIHPLTGGDYSTEVEELREYIFKRAESLRLKYASKL